MSNKKNITAAPKVVILSVSKFSSYYCISRSAKFYYINKIYIVNGQVMFLFLSRYTYIIFIIYLFFLYKNSNWCWAALV